MAGEGPAIDVRDAHGHLTEPVARDARDRHVTPLVIQPSLLSAFVEVPLVVDSSAEFDSVELQRLEGDTYVALVHLADGTVDLHVPETPDLDRSWFDTDPAYVNLRRRHLVRTAIEVSRWDIDGTRIDVEATFDLGDGRTVHLRVSQPAGRDRPLRQFIPTPADIDITTLRLLFVDDFGWVRRRDGEVLVSIDGHTLEPATFPIPLNFARRYTTRFAGSCSVAGLNPPGNHDLTEPHSLQEGDLSQVSPCVRPPLDLATVPAAGSTGEVSVVSALGPVTTGRYRATPESTGARITIDHVQQNWSPPLNRPVLLALATLRRLRRRRQRWQWTGRIDLEACPPRLVDSTWTS